MVNLITGLARLGKWLVHAFILQLFLLSLSFPILVAWGIAFSPLIFLGNILFTPVLTLFLALSCLIYILELCFVPSDYLCALLDVVTRGWMTVMSWSPDIPMIACPQAPFWLLILMPLGSWAILRRYGLKNDFVTLCLLIFWVPTVFLGVKWFYTPVNKEYKVACGSRNIVLTSKNKEITFFDSECALQTRACSQAWVDYTLSSELIKKFGATTIDTIIIQKNTPVTMLKLKSLCARYHCKKVLDVKGHSLFCLLQI